MATKLSQDDLLEAIDGMTVLELSELVKELEDKFGVSAAAPMAVAAVATGGGEAAAEEQTEFDVKLTEVGGAVLRAGYSANVDIIIDRRDDVLVIPERLIRFEEDAARVTVLVGEGQTAPVQRSPRTSSSPTTGPPSAPSTSSTTIGAIPFVAICTFSLPPVS